MSFDQFILREQYRKVEGLGDRLALMKEQIDWEAFRPIVASVYHDNKQEGGRPHTDEVVIARALLLQSWYGLIRDKGYCFMPLLEGVKDMTMQCAGIRLLKKKRNATGASAA